MVEKLETPSARFKYKELQRLRKMRPEMPHKNVNLRLSLK